MTNAAIQKIGKLIVSRMQDTKIPVNSLKADYYNSNCDLDWDGYCIDATNLIPIGGYRLQYYSENYACIEWANIRGY